MVVAVLIEVGSYRSIPMTDRFHCLLKFVSTGSKMTPPIVRFIGAIDTDIFAVGRDGRRIKVGSALMRAHRSTARLDIDGGRQRVAVVALVHVILLLLLVLIILAR